MTTTQERAQRGEGIIHQLSAGTRRTDDLPEYELVPGMREWVTASLFCDVWERPTLEKRVRSIATMPALAVLGRGGRLKGPINNALNLGWTKEEIAELFFHLSLYGGLPASMNALGAAREVFRERDLLR